MGVLINKKRCDNAEACPCIDNCPAKAFYFDKDKNTVAVHNELCINCRNCMIACEAGAVKVFRNEEEYRKLKTEYDEDAMTIENLFQDRYGAVSVDEKYTYDIENLDTLIDEAKKPLLIEFYNEDEASCLINSIPIKEILEAIALQVSYRKVEIKDTKMIMKYGLNNAPSLVIINNKEIIFKQDGFINVKDKDKLIDKLKKFNESLK